MADSNLEGEPPDFQQIGKDLAAGMEAAETWLRSAPRFANLAKTIIASTFTWLIRAASWIGVWLAARIAEAEDANQTEFQQLAGAAIKDMFGIDVSGQLNTARGRGGNTAAANAIGDALLRAFSGQAGGGGTAGELRPTDEPAKAFLSAMAQLALEGWLEGWMFEALSLGQLETFGDLDDTISHVLGLGRASAAVHGPLVRDLIVTPLEWKVKQQYRPTMLSDGMAVEEYLSGNLEWSELYEELTRAGWSDARINSLVRNRTKRLSLEELVTLQKHGSIDFGDVIDTLREEGWLDDTARLRAAAADWRRYDGITDNALPTLLRAFAAGDLTEGGLRTFLESIIYDEGERNTWLSAARTQRDLSITHLSHSEVTDCVELNILPMAFYREWLSRNSYPEDEAFALELRLRARIDKNRTIDDHRKQQEAERAAAKAAAAKAKAERLEQAEADRARARRGSLADLRRAAVRGLIPFARVQEILAPQYDADFIATYLDLVESDRVAYLREQQARDDAEKRATNRRIDVGALEQAVLTNVLDFARFHQALLDRGINPDDANLITATLRARKTDLDDAKAKRAAAAAAAKTRHLDLAKLETLVRRGARSLADYDRLLEELGFDDAARAAMRELLQLEINDDAAARKAKDDAAAALRNKGVSLETERRGVVLGFQSTDDYERFLRGHGFATDAVALMLREVQADVDAAADARHRRQAADDRPAGRELPLAAIRRAARLGVIDVATYQQRLEAEGYSPDDVEIDVTLLLQEIADVQAARQKQDHTDKTVTTGLTLAQLASAVRAGVKHLEDYRAAAAARPNLSRDDVDTLVRVLADELASANVARARRTALASTVQPKDVSIGALEEQIRAGTLSIPAYVGALEQAGVDTADIDLLVQLLLDQLAATPSL